MYFQREVRHGRQGIEVVLQHGCTKFRPELLGAFGAGVRGGILRGGSRRGCCRSGCRVGAGRERGEQDSENQAGDPVHNVFLNIC